jgi:hypothetical protein
MKWTIPLTVASCVVATPLFAQMEGRRADDAPIPVAEQPGPDLRPEPPVRAWVEPDPLDPFIQPYRDAQDWLAEHNFELVVGTTVVFQQASKTLGDAARRATTGNYDIEGVWNFLTTNGLGDGSVGFLVEGGTLFDRPNDFDLSESVGSGFAINENLYTQPITVSELWYEHNFEDLPVVTLGKIDLTAYLDTNAIANDETTQFLASPLVNNAAIAFPEPGLGAGVWVGLGDWAYVAGVVADSVGDTRTTGLSRLSRDRVFWGGEFGVTPDLGIGEGNYRLTLWRSEVDDETDRGLALSFDQEIGDTGFVPFFRAGWARGDLTGVDRFVSGGVGLMDPFNRADDLLAVGVAWARPEDRQAFREETIVEVFYRWQVTPTVGITPDVQFILQPADPDIDGVVTIFGLRLQAAF